jgi:hypothetical protein
MNSLKERLATKTAVLKSGCWTFTGGQDSWGYGAIYLNGATIGAHRASWLVHVGSISDGLHVLHKCDNRQCVNPNHLYLGTHQDNMKDKATRGRNYAGLTVLDIDKVKEIKRILTSTHRTLQDIGNQYSVSRYTIHNIKTGKTWKHVC